MCDYDGNSHSSVSGRTAQMQPWSGTPGPVSPCSGPCYVTRMSQLPALPAGLDPDSPELQSQVPTLQPAPPAHNQKPLFLLHTVTRGGKPFGQKPQSSGSPFSMPLRDTPALASKSGFTGDHSLFCFCPVSRSCHISPIRSSAFAF